MDDGVIDAAAAKRRPPKEHPLCRLILRKDVEGQRLRPAVHEGKRLIHRVYGNRGQQRSKNCLLHHRVLRYYAVQNGRSYLQSLFVSRSSENQLLFIYKSQKAVEMLSVYNLSIIGILKRALP